jgi:signal transduction histidine kinase
MITPLQTSTQQRWYLPAGIAFVALLTTLGAYFEAFPHNHYAGLHLETHIPLFALLVPLIGALGLSLARRSTVTAFSIAIGSTVIWSLLGQLNGATLVPVLVALFWLSQERPLRQVLTIALPAAAIAWVFNGAFGPFGWIGGPGLTIWPEMLAAVALGGFVLARRQWRAEAEGRLQDAAQAREDELRHLVNQERMRIARELHDVVAHSMAMINIQANAALSLVNSDPIRAAESLNEIRQASKSGLQELRAILTVMRDPDIGDPTTEVVPTIHTIRTLVESITASGTPTRLIVDDHFVEPPPPVALASFRIIQEALTNVVRHASSAETTVTIDRSESLLHLEVVNAPSSLPTLFQEGAKAGIIGMSERARSLSGTFTAAPTEDGGFRIDAELPLSASNGSGPDRDGTRYYGTDRERVSPRS